MHYSFNAVIQVHSDIPMISTAICLNRLEIDSLRIVAHRVAHEQMSKPSPVACHLREFLVVLFPVNQSGNKKQQQQYHYECIFHTWCIHRI